MEAQAQSQQEAQEGMEARTQAQKEAQEGMEAQAQSQQEAQALVLSWGICIQDDDHSATLNLMIPCHKQVSLRASSKPYQLFTENPLLGNISSPHE
jgi:hypothetical protein